MFVRLEKVSFVTFRIFVSALKISIEIWIFAEYEIISGHLCILVVYLLKENINQFKLILGAFFRRTQEFIIRIQKS